MCQNIDKQQNMSLSIYNSFQDNAHIFIRKKKKALDSLICRIWGGGGCSKCHKRPEPELLVLGSGINKTARPQGAESKHPWVQALDCGPLHLPASLPAAGHESRLSPRVSYPGLDAPRKAFLRGRARDILEARNPAVHLSPPGVGRGGCRRVGTRAPRAGGRGGRSRSRPPGRAPVPPAWQASRSPASYTHGLGLQGGRGERGRGRGRDSARTRNTAHRKRRETAFCRGDRDRGREKRDQRAKEEEKQMEEKKL